MYRRFKLITFLHGIKPECGLASGPLTSLQIFRQCTGKVLEKAEVSKDATYQMNFADFMQERRAEARRSFVARIRSNNWSPIIRLCSKCGVINKVFHYRLSSHEFVLVEMRSEEELFQVLDHSQGTSIGCNQFVTCNRTQKEEDAGNKLTIQDLEKISFNVSFRPNPVAILNKCLIRENSMSTCLENIYNEVKISDFGIRLRFLMTRQLETLLGGLLPKTVAFPFGSTVTGLGGSKCDLDVVILPEENKPSIFTRSDLLTADRERVQLHLSVIADVMSCFLKGCSNLLFIKNARVPIVRYTNTFTSIQCDLSLYNNSAVAMSQILYTMSTIDERVKPLVIAIKLWAEKFDLAMKPNTSSLSNFSLTLLVIFFLQQKSENFDAILPPWNILPTRTNFLLSEDLLQKCVKKFKMTCSENQRSLEELFLSFFIFYSQFDFKRNGLSLLTGQVLGKGPFLNFPIYIENPMAPELNVCKHVNPQGVSRFRKLVQEVCDVVKDSKSEVRIGDVCKKVTPPRKPQYIPHKYLSMGELSQSTLKHLRWMLQKDVLKQDIFLIGQPGATRRRLAMIFLEMTSREMEYVSLSRDTTEADLKQRREILGGTAKYFDQSAVRAAVEGRILILEGIEKAERNVLPVLNNLLENREMHLEDGRFLIPASRYDKLLKEHSQEELDKWNLVRVSDEFRVIALGLPVPKYSGNPLDPPLRSRFQARNVTPATFQEQLSFLQEVAPRADPEKLTQILSCAYAFTTEESNNLGLPDFPVDNIPKLGKILNQFPEASSLELLIRLYPYRSFLNKEGHDAVQHIFETFRVRKIEPKGNKVNEVKCSTTDNVATCIVSYNRSQTQATVTCGSFPVEDNFSRYVPTDFQENLLVELIQSHITSDFCIIGPKGCGKSATILRLANLLNYEVEPIVLYQDITSRDLLQQRTTLANGDTVWQNSPLIQAALDGKLAILDGIDRVHPSTLSVIHSLVQDRDVQLYDGKRLVRHDRYDEIKKKHNLSDEDMSRSGILRVHPSFRIVALAESFKKGVTPSKWLSAEMLSLFLFHEMRPLSFSEEKHIIQKLYGSTNEKIDKVLNLAATLRTSADPILASISSFFSTRQLLRIAKRLSFYPQDSLYDTIEKACLARFLPSLTKEALDRAMETEGIKPELCLENAHIKCELDDATVKIGNTQVNRYKTEFKSKVPDILFYDVPQHLALLEWLIQDFTLKEHLLLVGNQGVGKNKIADRLLQLLNRPREYIQLHRDTTVQTLTLQPTVKKGIVSYEDSPLVRAVKAGHVLVVDEADKAPTHVTCILKTLVERGEMTLSDGRKILPFGDERAEKPNTIQVHPDFRMIVLANRPGFPFLGNDFFGALGDLFSCHAVDNPSPESEIALLKQYGPDVPEDVILKLVRAFGELRTMADKGMVQYPYSTREVVNIVKHMQNFPGELLSNVVSNVFDFDKHSASTLDTLIPVLQKNGIPVSAKKENVSLAKEYSLPGISKYGLWNVNRISIGSNTTVEIKNIKLGPVRTLDTIRSELDVTDARGSGFSELLSYTSLPMAIGNAVLALAVIQDENSPKDFINILTINPFRIYITTNLSREVKILKLDSLLPPKSANSHGGRYKFSLTPLTQNFNGSLLVHEENSNYLLLVDIMENSTRVLDLMTTTDKIMKTFKQTFVGKWKLNNQLADKNMVILYLWRQGQIVALDLNKMVSYTLEVPLEIKSLQVVAPGKWLLQNTDNRKYLLVNSKPHDLVPTQLQHVAESLTGELNLGVFLNSTQTDLDDETLSKTLNEKISCPNRLFLTDESYAAVAVGFPELESSTNEVYFWPRTKDLKGWTGGMGKSVFLENGSQVVTLVSKPMAPKNVRDEFGTAIAFLEIMNLKRRSLQYIPIPEGSDQSWYVDAGSLGVHMDKMSNNSLVTVDVGGNIRFWETLPLLLERSLDAWQKLVGADEGHLQLTIQRDSGKDVSRPKHGKVDPNNKPHVGGNTWAGGTGGRDTAGLGGKGGPYRLDAGHDVHQISDLEKSQVPEEVKMAARDMGLKAFRQRLKEIQMSQYDHDMYMSYSVPVAPQVKMLKVIIENVQRKAKEREWVRHQTTGILDDLKLIEGLTGEKTIFRRRTEIEPEPGAPMMKPKRLKLVADVSGSMLRFNSYDGRLNRMLEASILVMEAFADQESKFKYDITGHSGDGYNILFVDSEKPPKNNKDRLNVIKTMYAHSQFCMSGDHTLPATKHAIETLAKEDCDEAIVIVLSDANLERYGIRPSSFARVLTSNPDVSAYAILIGSLGDQANRLAATLPAGSAFVCMDLSKIPQIMQQIFTASVLSSV